MISKIIGMDSGTRKRAIASIVTAVVNFLTVFDIIHFSDEQTNAIVKLVVIVITAIIWVIGFYYNECTSEENCAATGTMREKKREKDPDYAITEEIGGDVE